MVGLRADPIHLWEPPDDLYVDWFEVVVDMLRDTREQQQREMERRANG